MAHKRSAAPATASFAAGRRADQSRRVWQVSCSKRCRCRTGTRRGARYNARATETHVIKGNTVEKKDMTRAILDAKKAKGLRWDEIAAEIG